MSNSSNINTIDVSKQDQKTFFNNYFLSDISVSQNSSDAIVAEFEKTIGNAAAARALAAAVIFTSRQQKLDPMETLKSFIDLPEGQLNSYLALFLNLSRVGTSQLGINNQPPVSKYVARAILP